MKAIKRGVVRLFESLGYDIRRRTRGFHDNAYDDQKLIMAGRRVETILDLGANVGQTAGRYAGLFPGARIHSFEPFEEAYRQLEESTRGLPGVKTWKLAVSDKSERRRFYCHTNHVTNSLLPTAGEAERFLGGDLIGDTGSTEVETTTLSEFCAREGIGHIDILKMDVQGGEVLALEGGKELLERRAVDLVYSEVQFAKFYEGQASFDDIWRYLDRYGYRLYWIYDLTQGKNGILGWGDALFVGPHVEESITRANS